MAESYKAKEYMFELNICKTETSDKKMQSNRQEKSINHNNSYSQRKFLKLIKFKFKFN